MAAKHQRTELHELRPGQQGDFFAVLCERVRRTTRDGKPFFSVKFRDRVRTVTAPIWNDSPHFERFEREWQAGQHFKIRGTYTEHSQYGPQIEVQNIRLATPEDWVDGYNPDQFVVGTRFDIEALFDELLDFARMIEDPPLQQLVLGLLTDHAEKLKQQPAARRNHHGYRGGLLEHTVSVVRTGVYLADKYRAYYPDLVPPLNKDLVLAGCILHDIGKLVELDYQPLATTYTVAGELIGHILQGRDLVRAAAARVEGLNPELLLYLEHIIVSHQGLPEWGSPKTPMIPEALLVHHADDIDAKMNIFVGILQSSETDEPFSDQANILRRKLLRRRTL